MPLSERTAATPPTSSASRHKQVVLVVDDEELVRRPIRLTLTDAGFRVVEAENGRVALGLVEQMNGEIDVVLSDVRMPEMTGWELADALLDRYPSVPVILMSGYASELTDASISNGTLSLLAKPFGSAALTAKIRAVLPAIPLASSAP